MPSRRPAHKIFEPFEIAGLRLRNRFVRSATWDNTADDQGKVTDASVSIYEQLGAGGVGLIMTGFAYVSTLGQALPRQYGAHTDAMLPGLRRLVEAAHRGGAKIGLQIVHAGINSPYLLEAGKATLAVSAAHAREWPGLLPVDRRCLESRAATHELSDEEIEGILADFVAAALRAQKAGFDALQLHGAHGYLISQFLSPFYNVRVDRWGGSSEKRRRFHLELVRRVRRAVGKDYPLLLKFGVQDDKAGGLTLEEGLTTAAKMVEEGVDAIEVSGGFRDSGRGRNQPAGELPFRVRAAALKRAVPVPIMLVGGIRTLEMAVEVVDSGDADLISLARPLIQEPGLIKRWERGEIDNSNCISCLRCHSLNDEPVHCRVEIKRRNS